MMKTNIKILIVDDFATMRRIIKKSLKEIGFTLDHILEADDGSVALEKLKNNKIDLVLCDINMTKLDGLKFVNIIRSDPNLKTLPIIMITAEGKRETVLEAIQSGATDYIVKPFTIETLGKKIQRVLASLK